MVNTSSESRPGRIPQYSATLLVLVLLAYAAYLVSHAWREAKSEQARQVATIAALNENAVDIYFTQLQIGMMNLGADMAATNKKFDLDRAFALLNRFHGQHTELRNVMLIRSDGQVLLTGTSSNQAELPTLANDPAFKNILDALKPSPHFAIGQPVLGTIDKSWVVAARYAFTDRSGKLAYILSANLPMNMLQRYWVDSITPRISALGLVRDDGYLVSRYPEPDADSQDKLYGKPVEGAMAEYLRANKHPQQGQIEIVDSDGNTGLLAMRRLQHYPLTLFVETPATEIRAAWWHDMHAPYFLMALALACTFAFYSLKHRRRAWSEEKRRKELQRHYEHALRERSPNEIFMFDTDSLHITYANDSALEDLGYTQEQLHKKTILDLHPDSSVAAFGAMVEPLRRGERESLTYQTVQMRGNGSTYPVEVSLQLITSDDGVERFLAIIHDITALKLAEENIGKFNSPVERRGGRGK